MKRNKAIENESQRGEVQEMKGSDINGDVHQMNERKKNERKEKERNRTKNKKEKRKELLNLANKYRTARENRTIKENIADTTRQKLNSE